MIRVGLTGGIGSGKSTVAKIFELLGIPVYYADDAAKKLMNEDEQVKAAIIQQFGKEAYHENGLNREWMAHRVFNDEIKLDALNAIVHPATITDTVKWMHAQTAPYCIKEAALIFESGSGAHLDYVIGVYAPPALRIKRAMNRSNISHDEVIKRMNRQIDEDIKMKLCDFILCNDEQQLLIPQVLKLHQQLLQMK